MAMDEDNRNGVSSTNSTDSGEVKAAADTKKAEEVAGSGPPPKHEDANAVQDRRNAAKAFYRAMYAGEDVEPEQFGIGGRPPQPADVGPCPNCSALEAENRELEKQKSDAENYYKRILADFENYRKRTDREREESVNVGVQKAVEAILPALDDLDRAKLMLSTVADPRGVIESLDLVFARFAKCLEPLGVKSMDVQGEAFDPKSHQAVQEVQTTEHADGTIVQELRKGYMMKDKVIRPSLVNVASNGSGLALPKAKAKAADSPEPEAPNVASDSDAVDDSDVGTGRNEVYEIPDLDESEEVLDSAELAEPSATKEQVLDE